MKLMKYNWFLDHQCPETEVMTFIAYDVTVSCFELKWETLDLIVTKYVHEYLFSRWPPNSHPTGDDILVFEHNRESEELNRLRHELTKFRAGNLLSEILMRP